LLINAGPDFAAQAESLPRTVEDGMRGSPVAAVLLTNADLDHVLGLISMREGAGLQIYATRAVRQTLTEAVSFDTLLRSFTRVEWHEVQENEPFFVDPESLRHLEVRALFLPASAPLFDRTQHDAIDRGHSLAFEMHDTTTGKRLVIAPDVGEMTPELLAALQRADGILFDGTFWSDDELQRVKSGARTARAMGHLPILDGSLELLGPMKAARKSYFHINNTNPILNPDSPERAAVESAGIRVEEDGTEWIL
jgi:pyrroloquinoline quinone biosynthesis protein B